MAVIHHTTLKPTKIELLTGWLPSRRWYRSGQDGGAAPAPAPKLTKSGGFRLDDPAGEVGIEFMVVTDEATAEPTVYLVPMTYRGAPLESALDDALIGTMEHGVLGKRWVYDGCHDAVLVTQLLALIEGNAPAVSQNVSDTLDPDVVRAYTGEPFNAEGGAENFSPKPADGADETRIVVPNGVVLHVSRVLDAVDGTAAPEPAQGAIGHVARSFAAVGGGSAAAVFVTCFN